MQPVWASGQVDTVLRWMEWFEDRNLIERYPAVAVHGALIFALLGRAVRAERWAAAAERASPTGPLSDGSTMESSVGGRTRPGRPDLCVCLRRRK
jgi:LuxR family transcriptional regulator, maltose regulon positive regulatory protein